MTEFSNHEDDIIRGIAEIVSTLAPSAGETFIGDDAAVLGPFAGNVVVSTDVCVYGVHLDATLFSLEDLGFKAVTSALSDLAAMGARPRGITLGVTAPAGTDLDQMHRGAALAATWCDVPIVGGDLTTGLDVSIAVTVLGECPNADGVLRSTARVGDGIFVSGPLGAASAGLRLARAGVGMDNVCVMAQRRPWPRLREGVVYRAAGVNAMMDLSDGLGLDLHRMANASGVGFALDHIPVAEGATLEEALGGGEDYELLLTTSDEGALRYACQAKGIGQPLRIGVVVASPDVRTFEGRPLGREGWGHQL